MTGETAGAGRRAPHTVLCALALGLLAACHAAAPETSGMRETGRAPPDPAPATAAPPAQSAALAPRMPEPAAPTAPAPVDSDPEKLRGMDPVRLTGLLGRPTFLRRDAPAELWQYRHESCVLDLFLYPGTEPGGGLSVRHFEARSRNRSPTSPRACLGKLLRTRMAKGAGYTNER